MTEARAAGADRRLGMGLVLATGLVGVVVTLAVTAGLHRRPRVTEAALILVVLATFVVVGRRRIARLRLETVFDTCVLFLPLAAVIGPALALPGRPQYFLFRLLLAASVPLGIAIIVERRRLPRLGPRNLVILLAAWFAWLGIAFLWAPVKADGVRYLVILLVDVAVLAAVAAAGDTRRRLRFMTATLAVAYGLAVLVGSGEALTGIHPLSSRVAHGLGHAHDATGFFYNPNDFGTFIAIVWPYLLIALLFGRRTWLRLGAFAFMGLGFFCLLHTGSRSSLIAIGLTTLAAAVYVGARHMIRHRVLLTALTVVVLAVFAYFALSNSQAPLVRQFRLQTIVQEVQQGSGSGATRVDLARAGYEAVAHYYFLGVGPGNAENQVALQGIPSDFANLHDWWAEVFVVGGLPGIVLYILLYAGMLVVSFRVAARTRDPFLRALAAATGIALIGYAVGSFGPSTVVSFAPMWILFGLAFAVARRAHFEQLEESRAPTRPRRAAPATVGATADGTTAATQAGAS